MTDERQAFPSSITGNGSEPAGSVLDHKFGAGDPYTLGVEEEYQLLDPQTFDLVQHIETMLNAKSVWAYSVQRISCSSSTPVSR